MALDTYFRGTDAELEFCKEIGACELVASDTPMDRIPPYNLLHYHSAGPYFGGD